MTGFKFIIMLAVILLLLYFLLYIVLPDVFGKKSPPGDTTLDELEKSSEEVAEKKSEIRSATDQKHKQIEKINKNLKK